MQASQTDISHLLQAHVSGTWTIARPGEEVEALRLQEDYLERRALHTYEVRCFVLLPCCVS